MDNTQSEPTAIQFSHDTDQLYQEIFATLEGNAFLRAFEVIDGATWFKRGTEYIKLPPALGQLVSQAL